MISASRSIEPGQNLKTDFLTHLSVKDYLKTDDVIFDEDSGFLDKPSNMGTKVISTAPSTIPDYIFKRNA